MTSHSSRTMSEFKNNVATKLVAYRNAPYLVIYKYRNITNFSLMIYKPVSKRIRDNHIFVHEIKFTGIKDLYKYNDTAEVDHLVESIALKDNLRMVLEHNKEAA